MADEASSWNELHGRFAVSRIDHCKVYSDLSGVCTNGAEEFFSRMREDHRRQDNGPSWRRSSHGNYFQVQIASWCGTWPYRRTVLPP
jgi:hypothetical protein